LNEALDDAPTTQIPGIWRPYVSDTP